MDDTSSNDDPSPTDAPPDSAKGKLNLKQFLLEAAKSICRAEDECSIRPGRDPELCVQWNVQSLELQFREAHELDTNKAAACVEKFETAKTCADLFSTRTFYGGCLFDSVPGTRGLGEPCEEQQCAPGLYCDIFNECPGTCVTQDDGLEPGDPVPLEPGAACDWYDDECRFPYRCDPDGAICVDPLQFFQTASEGEACKFAEDCKAGLSCEASSGCSPLPGPGDDCDYDCREDLFCVHTDVDFPDLDEWTCAQPRPLGAECVEDEWCESWFCGGGICAVPKFVGDVCTSNEECLSDYCVDGNCAIPGQCYYVR
jgi:hypothetical protein